MKKSIYSLVLMDSIIEEIDKIAYINNTSRSNVINEILAKHLSYQTPQQQMSDIFQYVENLMQNSNNFQILQQPSNSMFSVKSLLKYKYKPTVRYSVELYKENDSMIGELKVSFRTQSLEFIKLLNYFFVLWTKLEDKYISDLFPNKKINSKIEDGKYTRIFILPYNEQYRTNEYIGQTIGEYIKMFDSILKAYFIYTDDLESAKYKTEKLYVEYLKKSKVII